MLLGGSNIGGGGGGVSGSGSATQLAYWSAATTLSGGDISYGASATLPYLYRQGEDDEGMIISGGSADNLGSNIVLYGENHATKPGFIELRDSASVAGLWDGTLNRWTFGVSGSSASFILNADDVTMISSASTTITTLSRSVNTGAIRLLGGTGTASGYVTCYGSTHATLASRVYVGATRMHFVHSTATTSQFILMNESTNGSLGIYGGSAATGGTIELYGVSEGTNPAEVRLSNTAGLGFRYTSAGRVHLQPAGSSQQMRINGATEAAGSVGLTLGNGPNAIATGTDPDLWAKITYNSDTAYVFPLWALS